MIIFYLSALYLFESLWIYHDDNNILILCVLYGNYDCKIINRNCFMNKRNGFYVVKILVNLVMHSCF